MKQLVSFLLCIIFILIAIFNDNNNYMELRDGETILAKYQSKYGNVIVTQYNRQRAMLFTDNIWQSCIDMDNLLLPIEYLRTMFVGLIWIQTPKNVLFIGLGGGVLARLFRFYYPYTHLDIVEINPDVIDAAKKYFYFRQDSNMDIYAENAHDCVEKLSLHNHSICDIIFLDAHDGDGMPNELKTETFFLNLKYLLKPNGLLVVNFFGFNQLPIFLTTIYPHTYQFGILNQDINVILVHGNDDIELFNYDEMLNRAHLLQKEKQFEFSLIDEIKKIQ